MSGLLVRALRAALPGPAAVRRLRTAAPRPAYAKELFLGELRKVSAARPGHRLTANGALRRAGLGPLGAAGREGSRPYLAVAPRAGRRRVAPRAPRGFRAERPSICARVAPRVPGPLPGLPAVPWAGQLRAAHVSARWELRVGLGLCDCGRCDGRTFQCEVCGVRLTGLAGLLNLQCYRQRRV